MGSKRCWLRPVIACVVVGAFLYGALASDASETESTTKDSRVKTFQAEVAAGDVDRVLADLKANPELLEMPNPSDDESLRLTPLHTAVQAGQLEMTRLLLDRGASVEECCHGATPLLRAAIGGRDEIITLLLKHGADINAGTNPSDPGDITPIRAAQLYGHRSSAQLLLEKGARIDFFSAAGLGWTTYVADRLAENPNLATFKDHWGFQAAWIAVNTGQAEVVKQLVAAGASIDGQYGEQGFSALHLAAERGYTALAYWLLERGTDVNVRDKQGKTPLDYAKAKGRQNMVEWFQAHGGMS